MVGMNRVGSKVELGGSWRRSSGCGLGFTEIHNSFAFDFYFNSLKLKLSNKIGEVSDQEQF